MIPVTRALAQQDSKKMVKSPPKVMGKRKRKKLERAIKVKREEELTEEQELEREAERLVKRREKRIKRKPKIHHIERPLDTRSQTGYDAIETFIAELTGESEARIRGKTMSVSLFIRKYIMTYPLAECYPLRMWGMWKSICSIEAWRPCSYQVFRWYLFIMVRLKMLRRVTTAPPSVDPTRRLYIKPRNLYGFLTGPGTVPAVMKRRGTVPGTIIEETPEQWYRPQEYYRKTLRSYPRYLLLRKESAEKSRGRSTK